LTSAYLSFFADRVAAIADRPSGDHHDIIYFSPSWPRRRDRMIAATAQAEIWDREYRQIRSIPSSTRRVPSKALLLLEQLLDLNKARIVLDAGCGNGRNAVYLAAKGCNVVAVDFSSAALATVKADASRRAGHSGIYSCRPRDPQCSTRSKLRSSGLGYRFIFRLAAGARSGTIPI
jgi:SAM-dependent methyltransferase